MTTPEDGNPVNQESPPREPGVPGPEPSLDVTRAVWQLRMLVCWLGLALLGVSVAFGGYVWKQNRNLAAEIRARNDQVVRLQTSQQRMQGAVEELAKYSYGNAELTAVFEQFGFRISYPATSNAAPAAATTP
jgi:hypothetical protein